MSFLVKQEEAGPQHRLTKCGFSMSLKKTGKGKGATAYTNIAVFLCYRGQRVGYQSGVYFLGGIKVFCGKGVRE